MPRAHGVAPPGGIASRMRPWRGLVQPREEKAYQGLSGRARVACRVRSSAARSAADSRSCRKRADIRQVCDSHDGGRQANGRRRRRAQQRQAIVSIAITCTADGESFRVRTCTLNLHGERALAWRTWGGCLAFAEVVENLSRFEIPHPFHCSATEDAEVTEREQKIFRRLRCALPAFVMSSMCHCMSDVSISQEQVHNLTIMVRTPHAVVGGETLRRWTGLHSSGR